MVPVTPPVTPPATPTALDVPIRSRARPWPLGWVPIMDRYILQQLLGPFLFGVGIFSSVALSIGVVFDLVRKVTESGLPMAIAAEVFLLKMPFFVVLAFPMSILLATLMAYSRLSADSELTALRSCGISAYRFVVPALVMSVLVTGLMFVFNEAIVPAAEAQANATLRAALEAIAPSFAMRISCMSSMRRSGWRMAIARNTSAACSMLASTMASGCRV